MRIYAARPWALRHLKDEWNSPERTNEKLSEFLRALITELNTELQAVFEFNAKHMLAYFNDRADTKPRISIKAAVEEGGEFWVQDVYRDEKEYYVEPHRISQNSGLQHVLNTGKWFGCNNVPVDAGSFSYQNPRLDSRKAIEFLKETQGPHNAERWRDCWNPVKLGGSGQTSRPSIRACYKSLLIIPMTLLNNRDLKDRFRKHFRIPKVPATGEMRRAIYGFLSFDHVDVNYFNLEVDVEVGYILADILSLYIVNRLIYTRYSRTFRDVLAKLGEAPEGALWESRQGN